MRSARKAPVSNKSMWHSVSSKFKLIDIYGQQINLTYKGDDSFKTMPGAFASVLIIFMILAFSVFRSIVLFTRNDPNISKASFQQDLNTAGKYKPYEYGFDLAFGVGVPLDAKYGSYQIRETYFYYTDQLDSNGNPIRLRTRTIIPFERCGTELLKYPKTDEIVKYGISDMMCFKNANYSLQGDFYSEEFRYLDIKLLKCKNSTSSKTICASKEEIDTFFNAKQFKVAFINQYFDFQDFSSPVKQYIDDSLFWELDTRINRMANFYIQKQEAQLQDDLLQLGQKKSLKFAQVSNQRTYDDFYDEAAGEFVAMYIRYDYRYDIYNRQVYSILVLLGDIGGLQQSLYTLGFLMIGFFSHRIFVSSILKQIYQIKYWQDQRVRNERERIQKREDEMLRSPDKRSREPDITNINTQNDITRGGFGVNDTTEWDNYVNLHKNQQNTAITENTMTKSYQGIGGNNYGKVVLKKNHQNKLELQGDRNLKVVKINSTNNVTEHKNNSLFSKVSSKQPQINSQQNLDLTMNLESPNKTTEFMNQTMVTHNLNDETKSLTKTKFLEDNQNQQNLSAQQWTTPIDINKNLKKEGKNQLLDSEINTILLNLINRKRFSYSGKDILKYLFNCICCKSLSKIRHSEKFKKHFIFQKGEEKLLEELNVVNLLRTQRQVKLLTQVLMNQQQKLILRFQRKNLIETSSSSQDSDNNNKFDTFRLMENKNPVIRLMFFGKMKKMISSYSQIKIDHVDRRLFRGLFMRNLKDFDELQEEQRGNKSVLYRLMNAMKLNTEAKINSQRKEENQDKIEQDAKDQTQKIDASSLNIIQEDDQMLDDTPVYQENQRKRAHKTDAQKHSQIFTNNGYGRYQNEDQEALKQGPQTTEHDDQQQVFKFINQSGMLQLRQGYSNINSSSMGNKKTADKLHRQSTTINYNSSIQISKDGDDKFEKLDHNEDDGDDERDEIDIENQIIMESEINNNHQIDAGNSNRKAQYRSSSGHVSINDDSLDMFEQNQNLHLIEAGQPFMLPSAHNLSMNGYQTFNTKEISSGINTNQINGVINNYGNTQIKATAYTQGRPSETNSTNGNSRINNLITKQDNNQEPQKKTSKNNFNTHQNYVFNDNNDSNRSNSNRLIGSPDANRSDSNRKSLNPYKQ
eukprot:403333491